MQAIDSSFAGGRPSSVIVKGLIKPASAPGATVVLQTRPGKKGAWKKLKTAETKVSGALTFKKVGKGRTKSFWLRAVITMPNGAKIASKPRGG